MEHHVREHWGTDPRHTYADELAMELAASHLRSLVDIGEAVSRSELETTVAFLDGLTPASDRVRDAIADAASTVEWHLTRILEAQSKGIPWGQAFDLREDILARLEDLEG